MLICIVLALFHFSDILALSFDAYRARPVGDTMGVCRQSRRDLKPHIASAQTLVTKIQQCSSYELNPAGFKTGAFGLVFHYMSMI